MGKRTCAILLMLIPLVSGARSGLQLLLTQPAFKDLGKCGRIITGGGWRRYDLKANLRWQGGEVALLQDGDGQAGKRLSDLRGQCFQLKLNGRIVVLGAIVSRERMPELAIPVLILRNEPDAQVYELQLLPTQSLLSHQETSWERLLLNAFPGTVPAVIGQDGSYK